MSNQLTEQEVRHVAKLARLELSEEEIGKFADRLSAVLGYVSKLSELDVDGVEPMAHALDVSNVLRPDEATPRERWMSPETALRNAPDEAPPFFKVPKVIGDGSGA